MVVWSIIEPVVRFSQTLRRLIRIEQKNITFAYFRLSNEEASKGESESISNQRMIVTKYCQQNGLNLVREFADDGWSGGNFDRPNFQKMLAEVEKGKANVIITKDLSRLGRDMREASYYAEQFFPERGIRYIAIGDNFDTAHDNIMAPFQFAMNEVYLRDGSRKVKDVLKNKREGGQYCACPPYGYKKDPRDNNHLVPDEMTAPVVQRIFASAATGDSSRTIAMSLNADGVIPPLKYRVLYRDKFSDKGASRASDLWNYTTVKRILKNPVYLGHTLLGKTRKVSVKSKVKVKLPKDEWAITENTHEPLVSQKTFDAAHNNMGKGTKLYKEHDHIRKSIFSGVAYCETCGHALCSCGTVYKGEREKYWYLSCINQRGDIANPCPGTRIRYADIVQLIKDDLNSLLDMTDDEINDIVEQMITKERSTDAVLTRKSAVEKARSRLEVIDKMIAKMYMDNAEGRLEDERLYKMVSELQSESASLNDTIRNATEIADVAQNEDKYRLFFDMVKAHSRIENLDRETLTTFVERIEVGPKIFEGGLQKATHRNTPFKQSVRVFYKFIGNLSEDSETAKNP